LISAKVQAVFGHLGPAPKRYPPAPLAGLEIAIWTVSKHALTAAQHANLAVGPGLTIFAYSSLPSRAEAKRWLIERVWIDGSW